MLTLLALCVSLGAVPPADAKPFFETGVVKASAAGEDNELPVIARAQSGRLFAVWTHAQADKRKPVIVGSFSEDGGRTWGEPVTLIDTPGKDDYDANIVVAGKRLLVYSTTTGDQSKGIDRSWVWMTYTEDD